MLTAPELDTAFNAMRCEGSSLEALAQRPRELPSPSALLARPLRTPPRPKPAVEDDFDSMWEDGMVSW